MSEKSQAQTDQTTDLLIVGAGPAGYTASIYASRYKINNIIVGESPGGQAAESHKICNYPGFPEISGIELTQKFSKQATDLGAEIIFDRVEEIIGEFGDFTIKTKSKKVFKAKAVLLAIGKKRRKLNLEREEEFLGKGVNYCTTCDGPLYKNKIVAVVGGSDSANTSSLYLSEIAQKVYQIYRRDQLRGDPTWIDQLLRKDNVEIIYNANVKAIRGSDTLEEIILDTKYQGKDSMKIDGLFIEIGSIPDTTLPKQLDLKLNEKGYIKVQNNQKTSKNGVWAAGDITTASNGFAQIVTACGEGAVAAEDISRTIKAV
jgi:thioredoxin reductase (NADPH)